LGSIWPALSSFKDLLKAESEFRLNLVGEGFSDAVREEALWRLDLYKQWLEVLKDGIGEPVFDEMEYPWYRDAEPTRQKQKQKRRRPGGNANQNGPPTRRRKRRRPPPGTDDY